MKNFCIDYFVKIFNDFKNFILSVASQNYFSNLRDVKREALGKGGLTGFIQEYMGCIHILIYYFNKKLILFYNFIN